MVLGGSLGRVTAAERGKAATLTPGSAPFALFPEALQFTQDVENGQARPRRFTVVVQNLRHRILSIRIMPPSDKFWHLVGTEPIVDVAAGLEHKFQVEFRPPEPHEDDEVNELEVDHHGRLLVVSEDYRVDLPLHALAPQPNIQVDGASVDLGMQVLDTTVVKTVMLRNKGHRTAEFNIDTEINGLDFKIEPQKGSIEPGASFPVEVGCSFPDLGVAKGEIIVQTRGGSSVSNEDASPRVAFASTVINHSFEILEAGGASLKELRMGSLNFNDKRRAVLEVLNNGPTAVTWRGFILTKVDHQKRLQFEESREPGEEDSDVAAYLLAAKLRKMTSSNTIKAFTLTPESGSIAPFGLQKLVVEFQPQDEPPSTGFRSKGPSQHELTMDYEYMASIDFAGHSNRILLPVLGKGVKADIEVGPRTDIDFGDVDTHDWADYPITIKNNQTDLPVNVLVSRSSYFVCRPSSAVIPPQSTCPLMLCYKPKALGNHKGELFVTMTSNTGHVLDKVTLYARGTCSRVAPKPGMVGGPDKLPEDFVKESRFIDPDNANLDRLTKRQGMTYQRPTVWEQDELCTGDDPMLAFTKREKELTVRHKDKYTGYIRTSRATRAKKKSGKGGPEDEINIGLDQTKALKGPEPQVPKAPDVLWTPERNMKKGSGKPRNRLPISESDMNLIPDYPNMPETPEQTQECGMELSEGQIASLVVGPNMLDFGKISACSVNTVNLAVTNHLRQHILFMIAAKSVQELDKTEKTSMCIPPHKTAVFPVKLSVGSVQTFETSVDYVINGMHIFTLGVSADVVPVTLEVSEEHLNFSFSPGNWKEYVESTIVLDNPHGFDAEFECRMNDPVFSVDLPTGKVKARSSRELSVRWQPENSEPGTHVDTLELVCKGGVPPHRKVHLRGELPEGGVTFMEKVLDFGACGIGTTLTRMLSIKNSAPHDCIFRVGDSEEAGPALQVLPAHGKVSGNDTLDLEVTVSANQQGAFTGSFVVDIRGQKSIKLPIKGAALVPELEVLQDEFDYGTPFVGSTVRRPMTIKNVTAVCGSLSVDLRPHPDFTLELPRSNWSPKHYDTCPLAEEEERAFSITIAPKQSLEMFLVFRPTEVAPHVFELPLVMTGAGAVGELRRAVVAEGTQPKVIITPGTSVDFGSQVMQSAAQKRVPGVKEFTMVTNLDTDLAWTFGPATTDRQPNGGGVFATNPRSGVLQPGIEQVVAVEFVPREVKGYDGHIPLFLEGSDEEYLTLDVTGSGANPKLRFDISEVVIPAVPLGQRAEATFFVINNGYDNVELTHSLPADSAHVPLTVELPQGNLIGIARERLPVVVSFVTHKPMSFTATLDFTDADGKSYSIQVTGLSDNSVLSVSQFLDANNGTLQLPQKGPLRLEEEGGYELPPSNLEAIGPSELSPNLASFLAATTSFQIEGPNLPEAMAETRGKSLIDMVETLSGKPFAGKAGRLNGNKKEAVEQIYQMFDRLLIHTKSHGTLLNAVKPHYLLSHKDFKVFLMTRETSAVTDQEKDALAALKTVDERFSEIQARAYNTVCYQAIKVYVLSRLSPKSLKQLKPPGETAWPPDSDTTGSNLYSVGEGVLLSWASTHLQQVFPSAYLRVRNFDSAFRSGLVLISLLANHWPQLADFIKELKRDPGDSTQWEHNAKVALRMWEVLQLPFELRESDVLNATPVGTLLLMLYLFQALPQLLPLTSIQFNAKLNEEQVKAIELTNPSRKMMAYNARLEGSAEFSISESIVKLSPGAACQFPVSLTPISSHPSEATLILSARREGSTTPAATLVFNLHSQPRVRAPLKTLQCEAKVYEVKYVEVSVTNPFPSDVDLNVQLLPEMAEPPEPKPPPPPNPKDKRRGNAKPKKKAPSPVPSKTDEEGMKVYPEPFGCDKSRLKLKHGQTDAIKIAYMPWREGVAYSTVIFSSQIHGQFCYELIGTASPADVAMKVDFNVDIDGPQVRDISLPFLNKQLEEAKKMYMDKHPNNRRKDQTNLIQPGHHNFGPNGMPIPGLAEEVEYVVQQNNPNIDLVNGNTLLLYMNPDAPKGEGKGEVRAVTAASTTMDETPQGQEVGANKIRLELMPRGTGIYPVKILMKSPYDTREIVVNFHAKVRGRSSALEFECPARQSVVQEVPLVNNSDKVLEVRARCSGEGFSSAPSMKVPPKSTLPYVLTFAAPWVGEYKGNLELSIPSTGETNTYALHGVAGEPVSESTISLKLPARSTLQHKVPVPNPTKISSSFKVYSDLEFVSGKEVISLEGGATKEYRMHLAPPKSGKYTGSITFANDNNVYVWHTLEVAVTEPEAIDSIEVEAAVRKAKSIRVDVANPLNQPATFDVAYLGAGLLGHKSLTVAAKSTTQFEFYFAPLSEGADMGRVQFIHPTLGEFWYELVLSATPPEPSRLPEMQAELGGRSSAVITASNPTNREAVYVATSSNPRAFTVSTHHLLVPPLGEAPLQIEYCPSTLSSAETATIRLVSVEAGQFDYECVGVAQMPGEQEAIQMTSIPGTTSTSQLVWHNPTAETATVSVAIEAAEGVSLESGIFGLLEKRASSVVVDPFEEVDIALVFTPPHLSDFKALAILRVELPSQREPILFRFPLVGLSETPSTGALHRFATKARSRLEAPLEVVLTGLTSVSPADVFGFEINAPPEYRLAVESSVVVTPVDTAISSPTQPLKYMVAFTPQKSFLCMVDLIITKKSGGRWRFEVELQATKPDVNGTLEVEASVGQIGKAPVWLYSHGSGPVEFTARVTADTDLDLDIYPKSGVLYPPTGEEDPSLKPPIVLTYRNKDYGKVARGQLIVETEDAEYTYLLRGVISKYVPPDPKTMRSKVTSTQSPAVLGQLKGTEPRKTKNFVASAARHGR